MEKSFQFLLFCLVGILNVHGQETNRVTSQLSSNSIVIILAPDLAVTNQPLRLSMQVKNLSTERFQIDFLNYLWDFNFSVTDLNGQEFVIKRRNRFGYISSIPGYVEPQTTEKFDVDLNRICKLETPGSYKVIVREKFWTDDNRTVDAESKPLMITIGETADKKEK